MFKRHVLYATDAAGSGGTNGASGSGGEGSGNEGTQTALTFEAWQAALPDDQKALIEGHTKGLKSALDSERGTRKDLEKQLRDLAKKAESGSEAQTQLTQLADNLQAADRKADFYEAAHAAGVKNLKLAYTVATTEELFDKHGRANFDEMKKSYPELFGAVATPRGDAGSGTQTSQGGKGNMNDAIRKAAGRS